MIETVLERAVDPEAANAQGLRLLLLDREVERGQELPKKQRDARYLAHLLKPVSVALLARIRAAVEGPLIIIKGPEVSAHYPRPGLRSWCDLDIIAEDAAAVWEQLKAAGFSGGARSEGHDHRHEPPLSLPGYRLTVEVHRTIPLPLWGRSPDWSWLLRHTYPARSGSGFLAPVPELHAVIIAAHAWAHSPFRSLRDSLDQELLLLDGDPAVAKALADELGVGRLWDAERRLADNVFRDRPIGGNLTRMLTSDLRSCRLQSRRHILLSLCTGPMFADDLLSGVRAARSSASKALHPESGSYAWSAKRLRARRL